jgi:hypothetical protein
MSGRAVSKAGVMWLDVANFEQVAHCLECTAPTLPHNALSFRNMRRTTRGGVNTLTNLKTHISSLTTPKPLTLAHLVQLDPLRVAVSVHDGVLLNAGGVASHGASLNKPSPRFPDT